MNTLRASRWVHPADIQKVNTVQTVNGRRMEAAQRNLHMQSGATISPFYHKGAAAKRSARHSYPQNQGFQGYGGGSVQSNAKAKSQDGFKFIVYFLPEMAPVCFCIFCLSRTNHLFALRSFGNLLPLQELSTTLLSM